ncbi:hypothetical protein V2W45_1465738 [Cenococcum geophilum]
MRTVGYNVASSFSTLLLTPLLPPMKYIPYIPLILKPKTKSKAKPKAKPKMTEPNYGKAGSPEYNREWADINNFLTNLPDSKVSRSLDLGLLAPVRAINSLDGKGGVKEINLAIDKLFNRSSLVLKDDAAKASYTSICAPFIENTGGVYNSNLLDWPSITHKRKRTLSANTAISSVEVLDLTLELALEDSYLVKRRSLISSPICILNLILPLRTNSVNSRDSTGPLEPLRQLDIYTGEDKSNSSDSKEDKRRGLIGISFKRLNGSIRPIRILRYLKLLPVRRHSRSKANINKITLKLSLKPLIIIHNLLGNVGQLILGYWYNDTLNIYASPSLTYKTSTRSPYGKGANNNAVGLDDNEDNNNRDDDFKNGGSNSNTSAAAAADGRLYREHRRLKLDN